MAVNKVIYGDSTLIDLTDDDVTAGDVVAGKYFHAPSGVRTVGTATIPEPATATPLMDGTAAVGTATKYAREDHVHPSDTTKLSYNATLFTTNPFAPSGLKSLYISKIDNAFFALDKRYSVSVVYDGTPVSNVQQFFDGSYDSNSLRIENGKTAVFTLDFSSGSGQKFAGYPYGEIFVSFYNNNIPSAITGRVYNNYSSQGVGWHDITFTQYNSDMFVANQTYYGLQTLEITITGSSDTPYGYTSPVEIELHATRPSPSDHSPIVSKYVAQTLYYPLTAPSFIGSLQGNATSATTATTATKATQDESGNNIKASYGASLDISGTTLSLKNKNGTALNSVTIPSELPAVTSSDNGKVLTVQNGAWAAATASSSSSSNLYFTSVACSATTGDFATVTDASITADHVVANCAFANPSAITSQVNWTTSSGSLVLNGTCSSATTANVLLIKKDN